MSINIIKRTSICNTTYLANRKINYIVIHYTAGVTSKSGAASNIAAYFNNSRVEASADFIVDDNNIVQYNPDPKNRYCWAVGGSNWGNKGGKLYGKATNKNCINIEICSTNSTGRITQANDKNFSFTSEVVKKAVELTKYLMQQYNISVDNVIRHYDVNGKTCPGIIGWNAETGDESKWFKFKSMLSDTHIEEKHSAFEAYRVKVNVNVLNIRQGAGTNYKRVGEIKDKGVYTIVQESNGEGAELWGKLKSGAGWIALDYVTKM